VANFDDMSHILSLDKVNHIIYVSATKQIKALAASYRSKTILQQQPAEMVLHEMWCVANLRIKSIEVKGDSAGITFHQPESTIQFEHPWPCPMVNTKPFTTDDGRVLNLNSAFYLTNHISLLDTPGEWYHDVRNHKIYYYPKHGETIKEAVVPALETLVDVEGTLDRQVSNIRFENITFAHTTWMRPTTDGHVPLQAGMYLYEGYKLRPQTIRPDRNNKLDNQGFLGRPASAVEVSYASDINFDKCHFTQLGSTGLDYVEGTVRLCSDGVPATAPAVTQGPPVVFSGITVPANGNVILIYEASVNAFAPISEGATITNEASVAGASISIPVTATATALADSEPALTISKSVYPETIFEDGQITYTFVIQNSGNTPATVQDNVVVSDNFDPILSNLVVTLDGQTIAPTDYTYNAATGEFATTAGAITVPAATFALDNLGRWVTTPGVATLRVTGTV
jgi:uncharacterized repeat protein (TIGR01451 family)